MSAWDTIDCLSTLPTTSCHSSVSTGFRNLCSYFTIGKPSNGGERLVLCCYEPHLSYVAECNVSKNMLPKERKVQQIGILTTISGCHCLRRCLLVYAAFNLFVWRVGDVYFLLCYWLLVYTNKYITHKTGSFNVEHADRTRNTYTHTHNFYLITAYLKSKIRKICNVYKSEIFVKVFIVAFSIHYTYYKCTST